MDEKNTDPDYFARIRDQAAGELAEKRVYCPEYVPTREELRLLAEHWSRRAEWWLEKTVNSTPTPKSVLLLSGPWRIGVKALESRQSEVLG